MTDLEAIEDLVLLVQELIELIERIEREEGSELAELRFDVLRNYSEGEAVPVVVR